MRTFKGLEATAAAACAAVGAVATLGAPTGAGAAETVTRTFSYTGTEQTFVVPAGVSKVNVLAIGGSGGSGSLTETLGGRAAEVGAELGVTPGAAIYVEVGRKGEEGAGGGASDVRTSPRANGSSPDTRRLVAGGGGGAGVVTENHNPGAGGDAGQAGQSIPPYKYEKGFLAEGGGPGTQISGGPGGQADECEGRRGVEEIHATAGQLETGGSGGYCSRYGGQQGGGGGDGYYGGGGGGATVFSAAGGGGGSSLVPTAGSFVLAPRAAQPQVQFSYAPQPNPPAVVTEAASEITRVSATLNATVNPENTEVSSCYFEYGTAESYGSSKPCSSPPGSGISPVAVSLHLSGLSVHTVYHFRVVATNAHGTSHGSDRAFKTLLHNPPTVTSIDPKGGPEGGGTAITISGTELEEATAVRFGSTNAASFTIKSPEVITAVSPKGLGTADVSVTTPDGTSPQTRADQFTFVPPPVIKGLSPKNGSAAGGTSVTITGTDFIGVTAVKFGSINAAKVTVNSGTSMTAVSPRAMPGKVDVTVTTPSGTSAVSKKDRFTFKKAKRVK
jgi:IPT/TIG domain